MNTDRSCGLISHCDSEKHAWASRSKRRIPHAIYPAWQAATVFSVLYRLAGEREREKHYISSSHLGLIRCLTPLGVSVTIYAQTVCNKPCNSMQVTLPHELDHCPCMLSKQIRIHITNILQALTLKHKIEMSPHLEIT